MTAKEKGGKVRIGGWELHDDVAGEGKGGAPGTPAGGNPVLIFLGIKSEVRQFLEKTSSEPVVGGRAKRPWLRVGNKTLKVLEGSLSGEDIPGSVRGNYGWRFVTPGH